MNFPVNINKVTDIPKSHLHEFGGKFSKITVLNVVVESASVGIQNKYIISAPIGFVIHISNNNKISFVTPRALAMIIKRDFMSALNVAREQGVKNVSAVFEQAEKFGKCPCRNAYAVKFFADEQNPSYIINEYLKTPFYIRLLADNMNLKTVMDLDDSKEEISFIDRKIDGAYLKFIKEELKKDLENAEARKAQMRSKASDDKPKKPRAASTKPASEKKPKTTEKSLTTEELFDMF